MILKKAIKEILKGVKDDLIFLWNIPYYLIKLICSDEEEGKEVREVIQIIITLLLLVFIIGLFVIFIKFKG